MELPIRHRAEAPKLGWESPVAVDRQSWRKHASATSAIERDNPRVPPSPEPESEALQTGSRIEKHGLTLES
jgi:hypothetical protein